MAKQEQGTSRISARSEGTVEVHRPTEVYDIRKAMRRDDDKVVANAALVQYTEITDDNIIRFISTAIRPNSPFRPSSRCLAARSPK